MLRHKLLLLGAGGFGREVFELAREIPEENRDYDVCGFLDDNVDHARKELARRNLEIPVFGAIQDHEPRDEERFICAVGSPALKLKLAQTVKDRGAHFTNVIHPSVRIFNNAVLGTGNIIWPQVHISDFCVVGNFVTMLLCSAMGHDAVVEDGCTLSAFCEVTGFAHLECGVFMGSHSAVLPSVRVGEFATIGAGSVAYRNVAAHSTVVGVPAKRMFWEEPTCTRN